jgi:uncharacterized membrane protein
MQNIEKPQVRFGEWISEGWKMFTEQWKAWVINTLVYVLICGTPMILVIGGFYGYLVVQISESASRRSSQPPIGPEALITFYLILFAVMFFTMFVSAFFTGGMHKSALKQLRGGKVELRDLFSGGSTYFPILLASILGAILTVIGLMLCFLPALIVAGCLFFTVPLIIERKLGAIAAMQASYELTKKNLLMFTLFAFVVHLIAQAGSYACYVGLLATIPLLFTITAVAYRDSFGLEGAKYFRPNAPPSPDGYAQPFPDAYQQPTPPSYGQAGVEPYPGSGYQQPFPNSGQEQPQAPPAAPPPSGPLLEHSVAPPNVEQPKPPPDATRPLASIVSPAPPAAGLVCASCQLNLPATAGFCPRCGTQVKRS